MPIALPTNAVTPIANAPQNVTRKAPLTIDAPPAAAANVPNIVRVNRVVMVVIRLTDVGVANSAARIGTIAPTAKAADEANAA